MNTVKRLHQSKLKAVNSRKKIEKQLAQMRTIEKRSTSSVGAVAKRINLEYENASDISGILIRKRSQSESIQRLLGIANQRLELEKESAIQAEQAIEFAYESDEKQGANARLLSLNEHISELGTEIKDRTKTLQKITTEIDAYVQIQSKINSKINQSKSKLPLRSNVSLNNKKIQKLLKELSKVTRAEKSANAALEKINKSKKVKRASKSTVKRKVTKARKTVKRRVVKRKRS